MRPILVLIATSLAFSGFPFGFSYSPDEDVEVPAATRESLYAEHQRNGRYFNPWHPMPTGFIDLMKFVLSRSPFKSAGPPQVETIDNDGASLSGIAAQPEITWIGHASFAIHDGDDVVLTDPHFGKRALVPARAFPPGIPIEAVPSDAFAVISHSHYDHLDAFAVDNLPETVHWFVPAGLADWFRDRGRPNVTELDWWETARRGRWSITCLPSQHWSRRFGFSSNASLWCSWLLDSGEHRYYFAGDTGYFHGFAEYGRVFEIDVALLPIGAYEPRWFMAYQHVNPREAYQAFLDLGARYMLPMHWGTFDLTHEPIDQAAKDLRVVIKDEGVDPARAPILAIGETWKVPPR